MLDPETDILTMMVLHRGDQSILVSAGTIIQCLQIAVNEARLPPLESDWVRMAIPRELKIPERDETVCLS